MYPIHPLSSALRPPRRMSLPTPAAQAAFLALAALALGACAAQGKLIDLESGEEIRLELTADLNGNKVSGILEDGTRLKGEVREVMEIGQVNASPRWLREHGVQPADTVYVGSGYLKNRERVIDFEYRRSGRGWGAIGSAVDNRGRKYKLLI